MEISSFNLSESFKSVAQGGLEIFEEVYLGMGGGTMCPPPPLVGIGLTFRVVVMEYRSMPTHVGVHFLYARAAHSSSSIANFATMSAFRPSPASDFRCFFELFCLTILSVFDLSFKVKEQLFNLIFSSPDFFRSRCECCLGKLRVQPHHWRPSGRSRSTSGQTGIHMAVLPCQFTRKG